MIRCLANGKVYIGSSVKISRRFKEHKTRLKSKTHDNKKLQRSWDKYGSESFAWSVVEVVDADKINEAEQFWIDALDSANESTGFNMCPIVGSRKSAKNTEEHCARISAAMKGNLRWLGKKHTPKAIENMSRAQKGRRKSPEHRAKLAESHRGKVASLETRAKMSASQKARRQAEIAKRQPVLDGVLP
jgi:group I intron endonuclease